MGGHAQVCPQGHYVRSHYNSCKHRACPQCHGLDRERWMEAQVARFSLACDYHHVVFTVPHELRDLWSHNRSLVSEILLCSVNETLQTMLSDPVHLGATPGIVLSLHTWSRTLVRHLHVHALVTAGGYTPGGWLPCREDYFLDFEVLRNRFRVVMLEALEAALSRGDLVIPRGQDQAGVRAKLARLRASPWYVRVMPRYRGAGSVLKYFSRYVRGGPLRNHQIVGYHDGRVTIRYRDHRTGSHRTMVLSVDEFLRRLFEHIPERGFRVVRYCGVFAPGKRDALAACRRWLEMPAYEEASPITVGEYLARIALEVPTHCPTCGGALVRYEIPRESGPAPPHPPDYRRAA